MARQPLDLDSIDRLMRGRVHPDDAPPGYGEVARLVEAVLVEASAGELARKDQTVAAMAGVVGATRIARRRAARGSSVPLRLKVGALLVGVLALSGANLAVAGVLPENVQGAAAATLARIGLPVPEQSESPPPVGPTVAWLCRVQRSAYGAAAFALAPSHELDDATQMAGETLAELCAG